MSLCLTEGLQAVSTWEVLIDNILTWTVHVGQVCTHVQQRLYFLRRLQVLSESQKILLLFYHTVIEKFQLVWQLVSAVKGKGQPPHTKGHEDYGSQTTPRSGKHHLSGQKNYI